MTLSRTLNRPSVISILVLYIATSILLTWPLILNVNTTLFGDFGDTRGGVWWVWTCIHDLSSSATIDLIVAPFGLNNAQLLHQPVFESLLILAAKTFGEITGYNFVVILSFPLTAFTTYIFLDYLLQNNIAAFIGGLVFGFSPVAVMQAVGGHLAFAFNMFIPLFLLSLFINREKRHWLSAFFVGLSYVMLTLNSLYLGYFAIFIVLFFFIFDYLTRQEITNKRLFLNYVIATLVAIVLILPLQYKTIIHQLTTTRLNLMKAGHVRDFESLTVYSARPLEYLLPSIDHPVLGRFVRAFSRNSLHGSNYFEQTLYLGFVPLGLCLAGIFIWFYKRDTTIRHQYFLFFSAGALWMVLLSMPPFISFGGMQIATVSYFMYKIAPMFRVYARFGILAVFFMACTSATILSLFSERMKRGRYYLLLAVFIPILIFEYWSIPTHYARLIDPSPAVYQWLAKEPGDFIIAEYPMMNSDEASFYTYLFWQRVHQKRMVNGATPDNEKAWTFFQRIRDLTDPETPRLLKSVGVKYVIVHEKMYQEGQIPHSLKRYYPPEISNSAYNENETFTDNVLGTPFKTFDRDIVFEL